MKKYIEKLHFITHDHPQYSHAQQVQHACEGGSKWIQYRCLSKSDTELLREIQLIAEICDDWGATLIVADHIHLHGKADIQGFHIEDMNANFTQLRQQVGENYTLGGSANTVGQLIRLAQHGADYAGFGPFTISATKPNTYPHIGLKDYADAMEQLTNVHPDFPVLAVGGIRLEQVSALMHTGIFGIAVSAAILQSGDIPFCYQQFYQAVRT